LPKLRYDLVLKGAAEIKRAVEEGPILNQGQFARDNCDFIQSFVPIVGTFLETLQALAHLLPSIRAVTEEGFAVPGRFQFLASQVCVYAYCHPFCTLQCCSRAPVPAYLISCGRSRANLRYFLEVRIAWIRSRAAEASKLCHVATGMVVREIHVQFMTGKVGRSV
jgi:hypothetical protein